MIAYNRHPKPTPETPLTNAFAEYWDSYNDPLEAIDYGQRLERKNAELLAALTSCLAQIKSDYPSAAVGGNWPDVAPIIIQAEAASAKATG